MSLTLDFKLYKGDYDGSQLRSHYIYQTYNILGNAGVVFFGKMNVSSHMIDLEDVRDQKFIYSDEALNFLFEIFNCSLEEMILLQRLFVRIVCDELEDMTALTTCFRGRVIGNDLFTIDKSKKLSVSIATSSPISKLMHYGINLSSKNTPLPTLGLYDLQINPSEFIEKVFNTFLKEYNGLIKARCKVKGVQ